jgi:hypothetical protein
VQVQANALSVFCVGSKWFGDLDKATGRERTMAEAGWPKVLTTETRSKWPDGDYPAGESVILPGKGAAMKTRRYSPQWNKMRECTKNAAAPCVVQDVVVVKHEKWKMRNWNVSGGGGGSLLGVSLKAEAGYGGEEGTRETEEFTLSNMVSYQAGKSIVPATFIDERYFTGSVRGGYFRTGAKCFIDGAFGKQYEYRDVEWKGWEGTEAVGSGGTWRIIPDDELVVTLPAEAEPSPSPK